MSIEKYISLLCLFLLACGLLSVPATTAAPVETPTAPPFPTVTPTPLPPMITVDNPVNCYGGPGDHYPLIAALETGGQAEVVGKDAAGDYWIVIDPVSRKGCWIESRFAAAHGVPDALPELLPPPTIAARPNPPENITIRFQCQKDGKWLRGVTLFVEWEDKSENEDGFEVYRYGSFFKAFDRNTTSFSDTITFGGGVSTSGSVNYVILAYNASGKSQRVEGSEFYSCK